MLTALALALALQTPKTVTDIQARIPKTYFVASLDLSEWKEDAKMGEMMRAELGDKLLLVGSMAPEGSLLTLIAEPNDPPHSPEAWRDEVGPPGEHFDCGPGACVDASMKLGDEMSNADFHAYIAAGGYAFDLHVSRLSEKAQPDMRKEFERIVRSFRLQIFRRGWGEDYPNEFRNEMALSALSMPTRKAWKERHLAAKPDDWSVHLTEAEFLRFEKAPPEKQIAEYQRAAELLAAVKDPTPKHRFALAVAHEGHYLALYDAKRHKDSLVPLTKSFELFDALEKPERASEAYNLACAHALLKDEAKAMTWLKKAIAFDERKRESAAKDADFDAIKASKAFQELLKKPADAAPAPK